MNYLWETFKISFYLLLVIAFILVIYYIVKNRFNFNQTKEMEVIDTMRLANGETIYLVKIFDEILMLGGTKEELNLLKGWQEEDVELNLQSGERDKLANSAHDFKKTLLNKLKNRDLSNRNREDKYQNQDSDFDEK